jgi:GTP cyclohydrolase II
LELSIQKIVQYGVGAVVYMAGHEGRGIGLWAKGAAYLLQDEGFDTYDANRALNLPEDSRDFTDAALVLRHTLKTGAKVKLLTNNVAKIEALRNLGLTVSERVPLLTSVNNSKYLSAKASNGHDIFETKF